MRLTSQLPAIETSAHEARVLLRERFADQVPAETMYDLLTVVTELVTGAVRHGGSGAIGLAVAVNEDRIFGEVQSRGRGRVEPRPLDPSRSGGLGLHIVEAITDSWKVNVNGLTRVSFALAY